jgi:hypothetical protein
MSDNTSIAICVGLVMMAIATIALCIAGYHIDKNRGESATHQLRVLMGKPCPACPTVCPEAP